MGASTPPTSVLRGTDGQAVVASGLTGESPPKRIKLHSVTQAHVLNVVPPPVLHVPFVAKIKVETVHPGSALRARVKRKVKQIKELKQTLMSPSVSVPMGQQRTVPVGLLRRGLRPSVRRDPLFPGAPLEGSVVLPMEEEDSLTPLSSNLPAWEACGASPWVLRTISKGYKLQFARRPPMFKKVVFSHASGQAATVLQEEITSLISKRAIREVPQDRIKEGFYSRYFLVPKKGGGLRPILDLRALNQYLRIYKFKMLTNVTLLSMVRRQSWMCSLDLRDAYFHIPIYPPHRKFLRFGFQGRIYEYTVLPFGLSLSPRVFVKCTQAALAPLRQRGIRIACYLDDWAIFADSEIMARDQMNAVIHHITALGFTINYEKSVLVPTQSITYIGMNIDTVSFRARLSEERVASFLSCLARFRVGQRVQFKLCQRVLGLMASAIALIRLGRLRMRPFQRWVASLGLPQARHGYTPITITMDCVTALRHWGNPRFLSEGVTMGTVTSRKVISTDASLTGWGATHEGRAVGGTWDCSLRNAHINYLELMAVFLALKHFLPFLQHSHVLVRSDNTTTVSYINRQGGLRSQQLHMLAHRLILWSDAHLLSLRASHIRGVENLGADLMSRGGYRYAEWSLHPAVITQIWERFGQPQIDLFASTENAKCPLFFSMRGASTLGVDALAHKWPTTLLYAFPPLTLIIPTLERVRQQRLSVILIAPQWGHWVADIMPLLHGQPWPLPLRRDLVSQARGQIFHPQPEHLALWAWHVKG